MTSTADDELREFGAADGRPNLKDTIGKDIRRRIFAGELRPGSKVDQNLLAAEAGVSRLPVREALIQLAEEGLVDSVPRRGAFVARLDRDDLRDRYFVYGALSGLAAARAVGRLSSEDVAHLYSLLESMRSSDGPVEQERLTQEFHRTVNRAGASSWLRSTMRTLRRTLPMILYMHARGQGDAAERQLERIVQAIETADAKKAQSLVVEHFAVGAEYAVAALEAEGFWSVAHPQPIIEQSAESA